MDQPDMVYKITPRKAWEEAKAAGAFTGAPIDRADGFIHFSTVSQVAETARRHFAGQDDLLLIAVETAKLGDALKFEPSRGGDLFPHLYGDLAMSAVAREWPMPLSANGVHDLPDLPQ